MLKTWIWQISARLVVNFWCKLALTVDRQVLSPMSPPSKPTANLHIFCVTTLVWSRILITSLEESRPHVADMLVNVLRAFPLCWVQSLSCGTDFSFHFFLHLLCFLSLSGFDPEMFCGALTPPHLPPSLRFSYSPVTLISMCPEQYEWVSAPPATRRLQTGMPFNDTTFTPFLSSPTSPLKSSFQLSHEHAACCLPSCLPAWSTGWTCNQKNSPLCLLSITSLSSLKHPTSIQSLIPAAAVKNHPTAP